jgi:zinc transport system substrate-binding protein
MIPMRKALPVLLGLTVLLPSLAACGAVGADDTDGPNVVASFYPLQYVAERVAGDHADVESLTSPGQEPHDLELTFKKTVEVAEADVVVFLSGFQPAVDDAVEQGESEHVVDAADVVDLHPATESEEEHASHADEEEHDHGALDPHFWLDPTRLARVADAVEQQLAEADPDHADDYAANLAALQDDLTAPVSRTAGSTRSWSATTLSPTSPSATASTSSRSTGCRRTPSPPPPTSPSCPT